MPSGIYIRKPISEERKKELYSEEWKQKQSDSHKGQKPWNTGKKRAPFSQEWKDKIGKASKWENNGTWKGDKVGYQALHCWIHKWYGKADKCQNKLCSYKNPKRYHWANLDHKYTRDIKTWAKLCCSCHYYYDQKNKQIKL